jgi:hypothetical protein
MKPDVQAASLTCIDCGAHVEKPIGGIAICGDCFASRGSCCPEFDASDPTKDDAPRGYASPPCSAHLFDDEDIDDSAR